MLARLLNRTVEQVLHAFKWLVIPISLLLFLQWPLREYVQAYSREANDLGQWLFALYVAASVTAATRAGTHLAADSFARRYGVRTRRALAHLGNLLALAPWAIFVLVSASPMAWRSLIQLERFFETRNPGYFVIKMALCLLAAGVVACIVLDMIGPRAKDGG